MKKKSLIDYLAQHTEEFDFDGVLHWNWIKSQRAFILEMEFFVENTDDQKIIDSNNVSSIEPVINFVDEILLYDQTKPCSFNENDYLITLSFNGKKGWTKGKADAFLTVLKETLDNGESDLLDFINQDEIEVFNLDWNMQNFENYVEENKDEQKILPYPKF